jgi:hypothetical protein
MLAAIASAVILLDVADCWAARRQGWRPLSARFDMEVDAFAISVLAIAVVKAATVPFRVLAIGAMPLSLARGGVDAAGLRGLLRACRPPTRAVAVTQSIALLSPSATSPGWAARSCALALGLLAFSCAADIVMVLSIPPNRVGRR